MPADPVPGQARGRARAGRGVPAAVGRAGVPAVRERAVRVAARAERAQCQPGRAAVQLGDQLPHHRREPGGRAGRRRPGERKPERGSGFRRLGVQVVHDLHVVADEADRHQHHGRRRARRQRAAVGGPSPGRRVTVRRLTGQPVALPLRQRGQVVVHVRSQPGHARRAAAALEDQVVAEGATTHPFGDQSGRFRQLGLVAAADRTPDGGALGHAAAAGGHAERDAVRGEHQPGAGLGRPGQAGQGLLGAGGERLDEAGVVEVGADLVDPGRVRPGRGHRPVDVVQVLAAGRVGAVGGRRERDRASHAVGRHPPHGVIEVRLPVPVAPVERQLERVRAEGGADRGEHVAALGVDRADPVDRVVVLGHLRQPLPGDAAAAGDVLQERQHVVGTLGAAEGHQQERVVGGHGSIQPGTNRAQVTSLVRRAPAGPRGTGRPVKRLPAGSIFRFCSVFGRKGAR